MRDSLFGEHSPIAIPPLPNIQPLVGSVRELLPPFVHNTPVRKLELKTTCSTEALNVAFRFIPYTQRLKGICFGI